MSINPAKLPRDRKWKIFSTYFSPFEGYDFHSNQIVTHAPECVEEIRFVNRDIIMEREDYPCFSPILNLRDLRLMLKSQHRERMDFSFAKHYPKLQSFRLFLFEHEAENLDFLDDLPCLKSFSFLAQKSSLKKPMKSLPNLTQLEKFKLCLWNSEIFAIEDIKDFISKNKDLKELDLGLRIQDVGVILEENEDFVLPVIEKLRLTFDNIELPYAGGAKRIAEVLKKHDSIKELTFELSHSFADLNATLLKDGVAKMKLLEKFSLRFRSSGRLEENKFKHLKDVFTSQTGLIELDLDLRSDNLGTRELGVILDGLMKLKNLEKFILKARLAKMTPAAFNKLSDFIVSLRHLKKLELNLSGVSKEDEEELRWKMFPKFSLSEDSFSFSSDVAFPNIFLREYNEDFPLMLLENI